MADISQEEATQRLQADPRYQALVKQWLDLQAQSRTVRDTTPILQQIKPIREQITKLAEQYAPDGYQVTGIDGTTGAPLWTRQNHAFRDFLIDAGIAAGAGIGGGYLAGAMNGGGAVEAGAKAGSAIPTTTLGTQIPLQSTIPGSFAAGQGVLPTAAAIPGSAAFSTVSPTSAALATGGPAGGTTLAALNGAGQAATPVPPTGPGTSTPAAANSSLYDKILKGAGGYQGLIGDIVGLFGTLKTTDAQSKAAQQQTDAINKAMALQQQIYQDQVGRTQPYADLGAKAVGVLGSVQPYQQAFQRGGQNLGVQAFGANSPLQNFQPNPPSQGSTLAGLLQGGLAQGAQDPLVKVRAPDGTVGSFPRSVAQFYVSRGATILG